MEKKKRADEEKDEEKTNGDEVEVIKEEDIKKTYKPVLYSYEVPQFSKTLIEAQKAWHEQN
ncbi:hypothetical protein BACCIP111899_02973 [Bacillus rhizoplanae]|uniref:YfhE-like protein n=1 Tax=Bacillus rhizoplanae TaxID=2880966 RepID=A0ABN7ZXZ1_9BACI|nr:hypothetical protein [Bacillus rhizoplanae]CAG9613754.1 hypothetical protein BACCIP111899_02973 [Bacillus rhizoplanae]